MIRQLTLIAIASFAVQAASIASSPAEAPIMSLAEATQENRLLQAQEIFGKRSSVTSLVLTTAEKKNLSEFVVQHLGRALPALYKDQAESLAQTLLSSSVIHSVDPLLALAVIRQESNYQPDAMGRHGEIGLMQIKPETARWVAKQVGFEWTDETTLFDPRVNVQIGTAYLRILRSRFNNHGRHYLAAYNLGPAALRSKLRSNQLPTQYSSSLGRHYANLYRGWTQFDSRIVASRD